MEGEYPGQSHPSSSSCIAIKGLLGGGSVDLKRSEFPETIFPLTFLAASSTVCDGFFSKTEHGGGADSSGCACGHCGITSSTGGCSGGG